MTYQEILDQLFDKIEDVIKDDELFHYLRTVKNDYQERILPVLTEIESNNLHLVFYKEALTLELTNNITLNNAENILNIIIVTNDKLLRQLRKDHSCPNSLS